MTLKILGSVFVIAACGGFGFKIASNHIKEERTLRQLIAILDYMECELQYRLTPLPILCRQAAAETRDIISKVLLSLARELEDQISPDVERCMNAALSKIKDMPRFTHDAMQLLGRCLGRFDLEGQLKGLEGVRRECRRNLEMLTKNKDARLRGYQTLGLCAGAALVILFM